MNEVAVAENAEELRNWMLDEFDELNCNFNTRGELSQAIERVDKFNATSIPEQQFDFNIRSDMNDSPTLLHCASARGELEYVNWLLKKGVTWQTTNVSDTPLHVAVAREHYTYEHTFDGEFTLNSSVNTVSVLLQHLADTGLTYGTDGKRVPEWHRLNMWMKSPLDYSARVGGAEVLKLFISKGAQVNGPLFSTQHGEIPDDVRGTFQYTRGTFPHTSEPGLYTQFGSSLLHQAIKYHNMDAFHVLMADGANKHVYDNKGETPLMCAVMHLNLEAVEYLLASPDIDVSQVHGKAFQNTADVGADRIEDPNTSPQPQFKNWNVLHCLASAHGDSGNPFAIDIMWMLLNAGVDVRAKTIDEKTPLDIAKEYNNKTMTSVFKRWENESPWSDNFKTLRDEAVFMALHKRVGDAPRADNGKFSMKHLPPELIKKLLIRQS
ncbi:ankyrin repeat-containing domain protein [Baffinella frigidus]|nr:ankyrin repeat-containing domain protein [Cryptophyta sp. CCMP2293]